MFDPVIGLRNVVNEASNIYEQHVRQLGLSRADFWAKCAQVAAEAGRRNAGEK